MKRVVINIRASKNISGLVKVSVTSPAGLMNFFLNVEPCYLTCLRNGESMEYSGVKQHCLYDLCIRRMGVWLAYIWQKKCR